MRKALEAVVDRRFKPQQQGRTPSAVLPAGASIARDDLEAALAPVKERLTALERRVGAEAHQEVSSEGPAAPERVDHERPALGP